MVEEDATVESIGINLVASSALVGENNFPKTCPSCPDLPCS